MELECLVFRLSTTSDMGELCLRKSTLDDFFDMPGEGAILPRSGDDQHPSLSPRPGDAISVKKARILFREEAARFPVLGNKKMRLEFYPYSTIKYTIRENDGTVLFRLGDIYQMALEDEFRAVLRKMLRHFLGRLNTTRDEGFYEGFIRRKDVDERWHRIRVERGRGKRTLPPKGLYHDLRRIGMEVAKTYFPPDFVIPELGWSQRKAKRRYGHFDSDYRFVIISRALDSPDVPESVVAYILIHEFLHEKHGVVEKEGRSLVHTNEFRKDERKFKEYDSAKRFLREFSAGRR